MSPFLTSRREYPACVAAGLALSAVAVATADAGTVTYLSTSRSISANADIPRTATPDDQSVSADLGAFNDTVSADFATTTARSRASASMNATEFGQDGFSFTGSLSYDVQQTELDDEGFPEPGVRANPLATVAVEFSIDEPYDFTVTNNVDVLTDDPGKLSETFVEFFGGGDAGESSGRLPAGTYNLNFARSFESNDAGPEARSYDEEFSFAFALSPADGNGGGGEPNPIPLPPAAWTGLSVMAAIGVSHVLRARRATHT